MARAAITPITPKGPHPALPVAANSLDFTWTDGNAADGHTVRIGAEALLLVRNTGAGNRTFTVQSVADGIGREGDIGAYTVGAGEFAMVLLSPKGFRQSDGTIHIDVEHAEIDLAVVLLP